MAPPPDTAGEPTPPQGPAEDAATSQRDRLERLGGDKGLSLSERLIAGLSERLYASPVHKLRLKGRFPLKLQGVPADPVPGDPAVGERLVAGRLIHAGHTAFVRDLDFAAPSHPPAWREWADSWAWLRDLAAHLPDEKAAARLAEPLAARWLARFPDFDRQAWRADTSGQRLLMAVSYAPLILSSSDQIYRSSLLSGMATWARHLDRAAFRLPEGVAQVRALAGLWAAGFLLPGGDQRMQRAADGMAAALGRLVLADGGVASRAPVDAREIIELLQHVQAAAAAVGRPLPAFVGEVQAQLLAGLAALAMGDGMIGAWGGSAPIAADTLARLGAPPSSIPPSAIPPKAAPRKAVRAPLAMAAGPSGYRRLVAGKTLLVVDAGPPPLARLAPEAHAGTLAFEMSDGDARLIVNCGGVRGLRAGLPGPLAAGLRTTAAHSTLVVADTNSTRIREDGALGLGVERVDVETRASSEGLWLEATHDGYARRYGLTVRRRLWLAPDGLDLRGEDAVEPAPVGALKRRNPRSFDLRFHLGPEVSATPTADAAGALLKLPNGRLWQMKARGGTLSIEPSLWVDPEGQLHKTSQLVISGQTEKGAATIGWSLKRAGRQSFS